MHFLTQLLSEIEFGKFIGLAIPVCAILIGGAITISGMYFQNQRKQMWHETARVALERGQPLPALPDEPNHDEEKAAVAPDHDRRAGRNDVRSGLILIAVGAGIYVFLASLVSSALANVGAIPGFIGVALLLCGWLRSGRNRDTSPGNPAR